MPNSARSAQLECDQKSSIACIARPNWFKTWHLAVFALSGEEVTSAGKLHDPDRGVVGAKPAVGVRQPARRRDGGVQPLHHDEGAFLEREMRLLEALRVTGSVEVVAPVTVRVFVRVELADVVRLAHRAQRPRAAGDDGHRPGLHAIGDLDRVSALQDAGEPLVLRALAERVVGAEGLGPRDPEAEPEQQRRRRQRGDQRGATPSISRTNPPAPAASVTTPGGPGYPPAGGWSPGMGCRLRVCLADEHGGTGPDHG